jgi:hypothetical protein
VKHREELSCARGVFTEPQQQLRERGANAFHCGAIIDFFPDRRRDFLDHEGPVRRGEVLKLRRDRHIEKLVAQVTKLDAIAKQQTNKAASGDLKATALLLGILEKRESEGRETLPPMLQALRAIHAKHEAADQNDRRMPNDED